MDMAERYGADLRRRLRSAERLSDRAIAVGVLLAKTRRSKSSASLLRVTEADHFRRADGLRLLVALAGLRLLACAGFMTGR
jgi:hypothetical protein